VIEESEEYSPINKYNIIFAVFVVILFLIPSVLFLANNPPSEVDFDDFGLLTIFYVWLIPAGLSFGIFIISFIYVRKNKKLFLKHKSVEDDLPHLLNYIYTYLTLNVPMENIFKEIINDYDRHGFKSHPSVSILDKISFKLNHLKTNLKEFVDKFLDKISSVKSFNEILKQIISFNDLSTKEASMVTKRLREQRVNVVKLNDYILTLLSSTISLISSTMIMLSPLLGAMAIIMAMFVVTFIEFLTEQLEVIANLGNTGGGVSLELIDVEKIISPVYLELIIAFYILEVILILALIKSNIQNGFNNYKIIETIRDGQLGFLIFSVILFGGYKLFQIMFADALGISLN
jgi:hypothetical protein